MLQLKFTQIALDHFKLITLVNVNLHMLCIYLEADDKNIDVDLSAVVLYWFVYQWNR